MRESVEKTLLEELTAVIALGVKRLGVLEVDDKRKERVVKQLARYRTLSFQYEKYCSTLTEKMTKERHQWRIKIDVSIDTLLKTLYKQKLMTIVEFSHFRSKNNQPNNTVVNVINR